MAEITEGHGVDVVYDPVGMIVPSLKVIAWNGRIIVVGFAAGTIEKIPANLILLKNVAVTGVHWGAYVRNEPDKIGETWEALLHMFKTKKVTPTVFEHIYEGLESVPEGLKDLADRKTWGKRWSAFVLILSSRPRASTSSRFFRTLVTLGV